MLMYAPTRPIVALRVSQALAERDAFRFRTRTALATPYRVRSKDRPQVH